jgi:hypothetical protein
VQFSRRACVDAIHDRMQCAAGGPTTRRSSAEAIHVAGNGADDVECTMMLLPN